MECIKNIFWEIEVHLGICGEEYMGETHSDST